MFLFFFDFRNADVWRSYFCFNWPFVQWHSGYFFYLFCVCSFALSLDIVEAHRLYYLALVIKWSCRRAFRINVTSPKHFQLRHVCSSWQLKYLVENINCHHRLAVIRWQADAVNYMRPNFILLVFKSLQPHLNIVFFLLNFIENEKNSWRNSNRLTACHRLCIPSVSVHIFSIISKHQLSKQFLVAQATANHIRTGTNGSLLSHRRRKKKKAIVDTEKAMGCDGSQNQYSSNLKKMNGNINTNNPDWLNWHVSFFR